MDEYDDEVEGNVNHSNDDNILMMEWMAMIMKQMAMIMMATVMMMAMITLVMVTSM